VSASVATDAIGNVHVVWADNMVDNYEIYYRKFTAGLGWGSVFQVSKSSALAWSPSIGVDPDGNAYVVWSDKRDGNFEIYLRRYLEGVGWGAEKRMSYNSAVSSNPSAAVDPQGNLHVVWEDYRYGNEEILYRCVSSREGPGWDPLETRLTNDLSTSWDPSVAADPSGNVHVVWADNRDLNFEIYYKFGLKSVTVGIELQAFYAECTPDGVLLRWETGTEASGSLVDVYRRDDDLATPAKISSAPLFAVKEFLDTGVSEGTTYQYFIGIWENKDGEQLLFGPVSVTYKSPAVGAPYLAAWPNPFSGPLNLKFAAEGENLPFKLTLLDVNGRVVAEIASGVISSRVMSFPWDPSRTSNDRLSPGIYFVSLETGGKRLEKKVVFLK